MARRLSSEEIPSGWTYSLLDQTASRCSGHTPSKSSPEYWNGGVKWISLTDSSKMDQGYIYKTAKEISSAGIENSSAQIHPAETVVLCRDAGIGKSCVMAEPMAVSQHFIAWRCDNSHTINSWYLYNWLQYYKKEFERQAVGSTIKTIGLPYFKKLNLALPPFGEQKKIAQILATWDKAIATTEQLLANSQQQKKALMQQLLTGKKRLLGDDGKRFSDSWMLVKVGELGEVSSGGTPKTTVLQNWDGDISWLTPTDVTSNKTKYIAMTKRRITELGLKSSSAKLLPPGSLLFCTRATIGALAISKTSITTNQGFKNLVPSKKYDVEFIYYLFSFFTNEFKRRASGSTFLEISKRDFERITFLCPTLREQRKISKLLSIADEEIAYLNDRAVYLRMEKKALMQQLLTGKRRVRVEEVDA